MNSNSFIDTKAKRQRWVSPEMRCTTRSYQMPKKKLLIGIFKVDKLMLG